jgi:hypothetical protein
MEGLTNQAREGGGGMGKVVMVGAAINKEAVTLEFSGASTEEIADTVALFLAGRGYRLEMGDRFQGVYGRGSALAHALLGPLVRRQRYHVTIAKHGDRVAVVLAKGMSGWGGGVFSAGALKREFQEIVSGLQSQLLR